MKRRQVLLILVGIFLLTLSLRLYFAFQTPVFSDDYSYYSLKQAEEIAETFTPLYNDPLSYGGRTFMFTPLYYYILAFFNLFMGWGLIGKIVPNLLVSLSIIPVFLISRDLSNTKIALFSTFISSFIPIVFMETVNRVSPYSAVIPLMLSLIYFFIRINQGKKYQVYFVVFLLTLLLTHTSASIFVLGLFIYFMLMKLERMRIRTEEIELTLFSAVFMLWFYILLFKKAFLLYGPQIIWYNLPSSILEGYFSSIDMILMVQMIGVIPFFYGVYILYKYVFKQKSRNIFLILSFIMADTTLLWLRLIPFRTGLMFLGIFLILLLGVYLRHFFEYLSKTRFSMYENLFIVSLLVAFITTSLLPTIYLTRAEIEAGLSPEEIDAFVWIRDSTPEGSKIMGSPEVGHLITSIAHRKNVIDSNYLFIDDIDGLFEDVETAYQTRFITQAVEIMSEYGITHIYVSDRVLEYYGIEEVAYLEEAACFRKVYGKRDIGIYEVGCVLR